MFIWTLPEVGASGPTGGDDGAGGYMPLAIVKGTTGDINWVHSHHNAKPLVLTNSTGAVVAYSGHAVLGFPGQFANAVGLAGAQYYYNRYRDYNDATGRYIQADPIGLAGDANPYAYAMGNTLRYSDPEGLEGIRLMHPSDIATPTANSLVNARGGHFYVAAHGSPNRLVDQRNSSGPRDFNGSRSVQYTLRNVPAFVRMLRRAGLRQGQTIVLASCNMNLEGDAFARALAAQTGSMVYATSGFIAFGFGTADTGKTYPRDIQYSGAYGSSVWTPTGANSANAPDIVSVRMVGNNPNLRYGAPASQGKPDWKVSPR
jgi:RHS repeat-associated protein